jgi:ribosomal protein S18 acetylase RimI-like enzyme
VLIVSIIRRLLGMSPHTERIYLCSCRSCTCGPQCPCLQSSAASSPALCAAPPAKNNLVFRPAEPSDADAVVPLIYSAASAVLDFLFAVPGRASAQEFLRFAFVDGAGQFGFRNHVVAVEDGVVVAVMAAWSRSRLPFMLAGARQVFACYGIGGIGVALRVLWIEDVVLLPPERSELYLGHLGVSPERRGGGIGAALMTHMIAQHRHSGLRKVVFDVAATNPRAQKLYERLGFVVTVEHRSRLANAQGIVVNHRRMEMPMAAAPASPPQTIPCQCSAVAA